MKGSAVAVGLLLTACGSDNGTQTQKMTNIPTTTPVRNETAVEKNRNMDVAASLTDSLKRVDTRFDKALNCIQLQGGLPTEAKKTQVLFSGAACPANESGVGTKGLAFTLEAEAVPTVKPKEPAPVPNPKDPKQAAPPQNKQFFLVLKGQPGQKQQAAIPDLRVGEFMLTYVEEKPIVKPEPVGQAPKPGQGKPEPVGEKPGQKPGQAQEPVGKKPVVYREQLVLTKLCSDEYASACKIEIEQGLFRKIVNLKKPEAVVSTEQKGKPVGQVKPTPVKPAPQQPVGQVKPAPQPQQPVGQGKPAPTPVKPEPQKPVGQKPA